MIAYLLLLVAVLSRVAVLGHPDWMNFTAVTAALLYFGARRPLREMAAPLAAFMATDYCMTVYAYHTAFVWQHYVITWIWYAAAVVLGWILLSGKTSALRVSAGALLGPTFFFVVSNFAVWAASGMYTHTLGGLGTCYVAGIPFYRNDLAATGIALAMAFGVPALVRWMQGQRMEAAPVRK
jgi:hypothetical protein